MSKYSFFIEAYYSNENDYLEIDEYEKELFQYDGKKIKLKSINPSKKIKDSKGIKIECGYFTNLDECISLAKKVYANFLIRLNNTHISYILDKESKGNFKKYYTDKDASIYKEIVIIDLENKESKIHAFLRRGGCGCTHFYFEKMLDIGVNQKLKDSLMINNYRKFLLSNDINYQIDNTLFVASLEMLLEKEKRNKEEIKVIGEVCEFLDARYKETENESYNEIKKMVHNNQHKSINYKLKEIVGKNSEENEKEENINRINAITKNRTKEVHVSENKKPDMVYSWPLLNKIQINYGKNQCNKLGK